MSQYKIIVDILSLFYLIAGNIIMAGAGNYLRKTNQAKYWRFIIVQMVATLLIAYYYFSSK